MRNLAYEKWKRQMVRAAKEMEQPVVGHFELTPRCNLDCKMCYIHNQESNALRDRELSTEKWKQIFDDAFDCGMLFANLTGGECLLRSDFKELYLHLWNKRVLITVMTNGTLIDDQYLAFFEKYPPVDFQISLYGSCEEGYRNVTGHHGFEKAVRAIRALMNLKIPVHVAVTPSSYMRDDFINIRKFCKENKFWSNPSTFHLTKKRDNPDYNDHELSIEEIVNLSVEQAQLSRSLTPMEGELPPSMGTATTAPKGTKCTAGKAIAVVSFDGTMHPCSMLPIGKASVLEMSYSDAWEKTKEAARKVLLGMECVGCAYDKTCPKCPAIRLTGLHTGHCNPDVCELTKRLVAAGVKKLDTPQEDDDEEIEH